MADRGLTEFSPIDLTSISRDGSRRRAYGYRAVSHDVTKHLVVEIAAARSSDSSPIAAN